MNLIVFRRARIFYACCFSFALAACGGGGGNGGGDTGGSPAPGTNCSGSGNVTVSGKARYEFVPAVATSMGARLAFESSESRPIRGAEVVAICPDGSIEYGSDVTDSNGDYSIDVPESVDVIIRVRASMQASDGPDWDVRVVDNTRNQATWAVEGDAFDSGTSDVTVNLLAASGWTGSSYTETRAAGPFAILDSVYTAMSRVLEAEPEASFPALKLNWSPENTSDCDGTNYPFADGCIGTSFYFNLGGSAGRNIFILGDVETSPDSDEYDNHVVIHEWGHYYEDAFARSDSIGGPHSGGDRLDPRVAFGEGWGNAWSGIATNDPIYVDTFGFNQGFAFDVEDGRIDTMSGGWWDETSVQEIIYDLYDGGDLDEDGDPVDLGFDPIHTALTNDQRNTETMTTIFSLIHYLKTNNVSAATAIDQLLAQHNISTVNDPWGDDRGVDGNDDGSDFGAAVIVSPVHRDLDIITSGNVFGSICTSNRLAPDTDREYNALGVRRFLRFTPDTTGDWTITLDSSLAGDSDPDFYIYASGVEVAVGEDNSVSNGIETETVGLTENVQYVIEVLDWMNADDDPATGDNACLTLTFESP